ncbi:MAG: hypothetical protein JO179_13955 [Solirubrobacterales bacterium]|nr:hypothetical protein [Solirubrobacterales bacterium]
MPGIHDRRWIVLALLGLGGLVLVLARALGDARATRPCPGCRSGLEARRSLGR